MIDWKLIHEKDRLELIDISGKRSSLGLNFLKLSEVNSQPYLEGENKLKYERLERFYELLKI